MFRALRVPERLFAIAMWAVSVVFASFLIGLGGKIVGELPGVDTSVSIRDFMDTATVSRITARRDSLSTAYQRTQESRERAAQALTSASNAYQAQRTQFEAWIATRTATTDPQQDPEVIRRNRDLDSLKATERNAQTAVEQIDATLLEIGQSKTALNEQEQQLERDATPAFQSAQFSRELRVFGIRLALTLPLLLVAGWLVARKRKSEYWPLLRGFVLFAVFTFFVELVLYLPSYGGYVRYGVGIITSAVVGVWIIRAMRRYVAKRQLVEQQNEAERRRALSYEAALKRIDGGVCPGCERAVPKGPQGYANFCVHCGLRLFDKCGGCGVRKNAFYPYCPDCGIPAQSSELSAQS